MTLCRAGALCLSISLGAACGPTQSPSAPSAINTAAPSSPPIGTVPPPPVEESPVDLSITYHPGFSGNVGWIKPAKPIPLDLLGNVGSTILDLSTKRTYLAEDAPERAAWLDAVLSQAPIADTSLLADEPALCSPSLRDAIDKAHPARLLVSIDEYGTLTPKALACIGALRTERLYLTGCLYRDHRDNACDGNAELSAILADESVRPKVRGLALSLSGREAVQSLEKLPDLEYLALSPGRGEKSYESAPVESLPFHALPHLRYLEASGENGSARLFHPAAPAFFAHLHTVRWHGQLDFPLPSPCTLSRASFDHLRREDVAALAACTSLRELSTDSTDLPSIEPIAHFPALAHLHLRHCKAEDLSPLARLRELQVLSLPGARARDFSFVAGMKQLVEIDLSQSPIQSLAPMRDLTALRVLDVGFAPVSDLSPIAALTSLERLDLHETKVTDLGPIARLTALRELSVSNTGVSDLGALKGLVKLERLMLYGSKVTDVSVLAGLPALTRVNIRELKLPKEQVEALRKRLGYELYQ
ncbi:MAG: hypothetical protein U0359_36425 [Byssovorax sp.]